MLKLEIPIECPKCHRKTKQALSRLKNNSKIRCPGCGSTITIQGDGADKVLGAVNQFSDAISKIGRKR